MPWWVQHRLHEPILPGAWLPLLRRLDRFIGDVQTARARSADGLTVDTTELVDDHHRILESAADLLDNRHVVPEREAIEAFTVGVLRALHYHETVGATVDHVGSQTLAHFEVDLPEGSREAVLTALERAFGFDRAALVDLETQLDDELAALAARTHILDALTAIHGLESDAETHALFSQLFPGHPLRRGEVRLTRTATGLFLAIPYERDQLLEPAGERTRDELAEVARFLTHISQFEQRYLAHFPVFGCFRGQDAAPALLAAIARHTGLDPGSVARTLTTMVTVLPTADIDKYIVHDAWGHGWQAMLFQFEDRYQEVATFDQLPDVHTAFDGFSLVDAARAFQSSPTDGMAQFDRYLRGALGFRLITSMSGLFAEVLADVVEYKFLFVHPEKRPLMPSSSFFKTLPTKLDLTLIDIPSYFDFATRGFDRFATRADCRDVVRARLLAAGLQDPGPAIDAFAERVASWMDEVYRTTLAYHPSDEGVQINVFSKMALHFTTLHAVFNETYAALAARPPAPAPVGGFGDILVFALASWFETDPIEHFWTTDDFLNEHFLALWDRFTDALEAPPSAPGV